MFLSESVNHLRVLARNPGRHCTTDRGRGNAFQDNWRRDSGSNTLRRPLVAITVGMAETTKTEYARAPGELARIGKKGDRKLFSESAKTVAASVVVRNN
jgi:hypothetical protein